MSTNQIYMYFIEIITPNHSMIHFIFLRQFTPFSFSLRMKLRLQIVSPILRDMTIDFPNIRL